MVLALGGGGGGERVLAHEGVEAFDEDGAGLGDGFGDLFAGGAEGDSGVAGRSDSGGVFVEEVLGGFFECGGESVGGG